MATTPATPGEVAAARREELTERALGYARASRATATWRAYEARWARFVGWCAEHGERAYPAEPLTICRFLSDLAPAWRPATPADHAAQLSSLAGAGIVAGHVLLRPGVRPGTVAGYLAAISVAHQTALATTTPTATAPMATDTTADGHGHGPAFAVTGPADAAGPGPAPAANPARHEMVHQVMAGISRHPTVAASRRRTALRPDDLRAILAALDPARQPSQQLATARDTALLLIGWKAALRTDDLARLDLTDLAVTDAGLTVHLRRSKTDQAATGDAIGIAATAPEDPLDAVVAWSTWRELLASHGLHTGPAWRGIDRYGRRPRATGLTTKSLGTIITRRAAAAGLDGDYGGHSLRRGFATSALAGGADERAVQRHGRWKSPTSMAPYVDEAERFDATNPTRYLT